MNNNLAVVIVTYNPTEIFYRVIKSLKDKINKIIVVDNGSTEKSLNILNNLKNEIKIIKLNENKGIAKALNIGIEEGIKIDAEWILTLDQDSIVTNEMLDIMLENFNSLKQAEKEKIAMIVPCHLEERFYPCKIKKNNSYDFILTEITSGSLVKSKIYKEFGMYNEKMFIDLVDHDYCLSLNQAGYKIMQSNNAILLHNLGESTKKNICGIDIVTTNHNSIRRYYMTRNRFYVWNKYNQVFDKWIVNDKKKFFREIIKIIIFEKRKIEKINMIIQGYKDYKKNKFYAYSN